MIITNFGSVENHGSNHLPNLHTCKPKKGYSIDPNHLFAICIFKSTRKDLVHLFGPLNFEIWSATHVFMCIRIQLPIYLNLLSLYSIIGFKN